MPTKKIADLPDSKNCMSEDHKPPMHQYFEPGIYEHTCPKCGKKTQFIVGNKEMSYDDENPTYISGTEDGI